MLLTTWTSVSQFETISHFLSPREPPPSMLLDRTDEEDNLILPNATTHRTLCSNGLHCCTDSHPSSWLQWHNTWSYRFVASCISDAVLEWTNHYFCIVKVMQKSLNAWRISLPLSAGIHSRLVSIEYIPSYQIQSRTGILNWRVPLSSAACLNRLPQFLAHAGNKWINYWTETIGLLQVFEWSPVRCSCSVREEKGRVDAFVVQDSQRFQIIVEGVSNEYGIWIYICIQRLPDRGQRKQCIRINFFSDSWKSSVEISEALFQYTQKR